MSKLKNLSVILFVYSLCISAALAKTPVLFVHDAGIASQIYSLNIPLKRSFAKRGFKLNIVDSPMLATIAETSESLTSHIRKLQADTKFHIIGHGMGGLAARHALQDPEVAKNCLSLTTLATPHKGSRVADWVVEQLDRGYDSPVLKVILEYFDGKVEILREMTTTHMKDEFNKKIKNINTVDYYSLGFYVPSPSIMYSQNPYIVATLEINWLLGHNLTDGPVHVDSAEWGKSLGIYKGDHISITTPTPFDGKFIYNKIFDRVMMNLERY